MDELKVKKCFKCNETKELSEFYKHKEMADGHVNKCKECNKEDVRKNRKTNLSYYKEYEKSRYLLPSRVKARNDYAKTANFKEVTKKSRAKWLVENMIKRAAHIKLSNAVRSGSVVKPKKCQLCGCIPNRLEGHHYDYSEPLSVTWLCTTCHKLFHRNRGITISGETQKNAPRFKTI